MEPLLNLRDLLMHEIDDLYSAEEQIIDALPSMIEHVSDKELKAALNDHLKVTREQKKRLDKVRALLKGGEVSEEKKGLLARIFGGNTKCKGTEGLITEGQKMMKEHMDPQVKDAAIIAAAQKIEHYEISGYGTARAFARELGLAQVADLLEVTLNEEYKADDDLSTLAMRKVNLEARKNSKPDTIKGNSIKRKTSVKKSTPSKGVKASQNKKAAPKKGVVKKSTSQKTARKVAR